MTDEKNDMFTEGAGVPADNKLLEYVRGSLSSSEQANLDEQIPANPFLQDAVEGLQDVADHGNLPTVISQLNQHLHHKVLPKNGRRPKRMVNFSEWIYWAILIILLLCITGFLMLRFMLK